VQEGWRVGRDRSGRPARRTASPRPACGRADPSGREPQRAEEFALLRSAHAGDVKVPEPLVLHRAAGQLRRVLDLDAIGALAEAM